MRELEIALAAALAEARSGGSKAAAEAAQYKAEAVSLANRLANLQRTAAQAPSWLRIRILGFGF